jgi:hypothetical protein
MNRYVVSANTIFTTVSTQIMIRYPFARVRVRLTIRQLCRATFVTVKKNTPMKVPKNMEAISKLGDSFEVVIFQLSTSVVLRLYQNALRFKTALTLWSRK